MKLTPFLELDDVEFATLMAKILAPLTSEIARMNPLLDQLITSDKALLDAVNKLIANDNALKTALTNALSTLDAPSQAAIQAILDAHTAAIQSISDDLVANAPAN